MQRKHPSYDEIHCETANVLWLELSPTNASRQGRKFIFRGQADSNWALIPSVLRPYQNGPVQCRFGEVGADLMVFLELTYLRNFARYCDAIGIPVPGDSQEFRREVLSGDHSDRLYISPSLWPDSRLLDLMAMAQHHGVPTRLLDWTTKAFTAVYFACSSALAANDRWEPDTKLAVWALNISSIRLHDDVVLHYSPGAVSPHLAAQGGLFTVHPHSGVRNSAFEVRSFESYLTDLEEPVLTKITLPVTEARALLALCITAGFSAANIYPSADGAGRAVIDGMNADRANLRRDS
jgi:hypothetical protein